jgi:uncharacterized tellurite resistance protein B-like protein
MSLIDRAVSQISPSTHWVHSQGPLSEDPFDLSVPDAITAVMVASMLADDEQNPEEMSRLTSALATSRLFQHVSGGNAEIVPRVVSLLRERGRASVLAECVRTLPPEMRETAFTNAVDLVFADGRVKEGEEAFIDELQTLLAIEDELALKIVEVLAIKSRT